MENNMIKKLSKFGNSMAFIIDKPILELLNILPDTELKVSTDGNSLIITPINKENSIDKTKLVSKNTKLQKLHEKNIKKYAPALTKLAQ